MALLPIAAGLAVAVWAHGARADVSGPACVTDGDTLVIDGVRSRTRCVGGTPIRLHGIDAPELAQSCEDPKGGRWRCGLAAAARLLDRVRGRRVDCVGNARNTEGLLVAVCSADGTDLAEAQVLDGWAMADPRLSLRYLAAEKDARSAGRGIWAGKVEPPWAWRARSGGAGR